jgi:glycosyltransferase involved in cell wall biosynthesis
MSELSAVALVSPGWPPSRFPNGIVTYTAAIRDGLQATGVRAHILATAVDAEPAPDVLPLFQPGLIGRIKRSARFRLGGSARGAIEQAVIDRTRRLSKDAGVRVLEMEESHGWVGPVAQAAPIPVVAKLHGPWFVNGPVLGVAQDDAFRMRVAREREGILSAAAVSAPSRDVLERTRAHYQLPLPGAEVIPCPIAAVESSHVWSADRCDEDVVLFIGRFDRHKGGDLVIDAFARLAAELPTLRLLFAGPDRGLVDDDGRRWRIDEYLGRIPPAVRERISYLGPQPREELFELRLRSAVLAVASRYENFAYTVLEAMSQGCPIVAARAGGLPEMIQHDRNGLLCAPGDVDDLAQQLGRAVRDPAMSARLGVQARTDAEARYAPPIIARQTLDFYRRLL